MALGCMKKVAIGCLVVMAGATALATATPIASNIWSLLTARGFFIPPESSIFSFSVTKQNDGSGEWWLYAEDGKSFFALDPTEPTYLSVPRTEASKCQNFDSLNQGTWCLVSRHPVPAP